MNPKSVVSVMALVVVMAVLGAAVVSPVPCLAQGKQGSPAVTPKDVGLDQKLDSQVPLDLPFRDEAGKTVKLGDYFQGRPVVVNLIFYKCPGACLMELDGMLSVFQKVPFTIGKEYNVVTVSIDPKEGANLAVDKKEAALQVYKRPGAENGWHFLTGDQNSIQKLAAALGYRYVYDLDKEQFAHPAGITVLTPQGRTSRYFYGVNYKSNDLRLGLVEASQNKIGGMVEQIMLQCMQYDAMKGRYTVVVINVLKWTALLTILILGSFITVLLRWEHKRKGQTGPPTVDSPAASV